MAEPRLGAGAPSTAASGADIDALYRQVVDCESDMLRAAIQKLRLEYEAASSELDLREQELIVWEQKLHQTQEDCLRLQKEAQAQYQRRGKTSNPARAARRAEPSLGQIAEGDEDGSPDEEGGEQATLEAVRALLQQVGGELESLQGHWRGLAAAAPRARPDAGPRAPGPAVLGGPLPARPPGAAGGPAACAPPVAAGPP
ncbi:unnamed protein product, partial [Prorocentrum cordatum]